MNAPGVGDAAARVAGALEDAGEIVAVELEILKLKPSRSPTNAACPLLLTSTRVKLAAASVAPVELTNTPCSPDWRPVTSVTFNRPIELPARI